MSLLVTCCPCFCAVFCCTRSIARRLCGLVGELLCFASVAVPWACIVLAMYWTFQGVHPMFWSDLKEVGKSSIIDLYLSALYVERHVRKLLGVYVPYLNDM